MEKVKPSVLVVGAGPTGLCLALALVKNGIPVRIIEKDANRMPGHKGNGVVPRSLELHHFLGTIDDILKNSSEVPLTRLYKNDVVLREFHFSTQLEPEPATPYPNSRLMGQYAHETVMRSHLERLGCFVEPGVALITFEQDSERVLATLERTLEDGTTSIEECKFNWLIGADGGRSTVRKKLGLTFLGEARSEQCIVGDMYITSGLDRNIWHMWGEFETILVSLNPSGVPGVESFRFAIMGKDVDFERLGKDSEAILECMNEAISNPAVKLGKVIFASHYKPQIRMVDRFQEGRVFVAGDAAHIHSPAGGQGLNSGLIDAANLAWKIALVDQGHVSAQLLESYNDERFPVIARMLNITTALLDKVSSEGVMVMSQRGRELSQLTVNYRWSSIVVDDNETISESDAYGSTGIKGLLRAGDRAPDSPGLVNLKTGETMRLFDLYGIDHHVVLCFGETVKNIVVPGAFFKVFTILPSESSVGVEDYCVLIDSKGHVQEAFSSAICEIAIIRPDGVIGALVKNAEGFRRYLQAIHLLNL